MILSFPNFLFQRKNSFVNYCNDRMRKYFKSLGICAVCLLLVVIINFALPRLIPGDPVAYLTGMDEEMLNETQYRYYRAALHLDENIFVQFGFYIKSLFDGSLGYSYQKESTVLSLIGTRIGATLQISLTAALISSAVALIWGLAAGSKRGWVDRISTPLNVLFDTVPVFLIGMALILIFCFQGNLFPFAGLNSPGIEAGTWQYFFDRLHHLFLPVLTLTIAMLPSRFLLMRNTARSALNKKYALYAKQRGLSSRTIRYRYLFKNSAQPFLTMTGMSIGASVGGSVVVENLFSVQGMGTLLTDAVYTLDYPLMQGILFLSAAIAAIAVFVTDAVCILIDPKLRKGDIR